MTTKEDFINHYKSLKENIIESMDKALERAIGNGCIDLDKAIGNYADVYPLMGAVLQREVSNCLGEFISKEMHREMKRKANAYRKDWRIWIDYAGDYRSKNKTEV